MIKILLLRIIEAAIPIAAAAAGGTATAVGAGAAGAGAAGAATLGAAGAGAGGNGFLDAIKMGSTLMGQPEVAAGIGGMQLLSSFIRKQKAKHIRPSNSDPMQVDFYDMLRRKMDSNMTGAEFNSALQEIESQAASTRNSMIKASGGSSGALLLGLARAGSTEGKATNDVLAQSNKNSQVYTSLAQDILNRMSQRRLDQQMYDYTTALGQGAEGFKQGSANLMAVPGVQRSSEQAGGSQMLKEYLTSINQKNPVPNSVDTRTFAEDQTPYLGGKGTYSTHNDPRWTDGSIESTWGTE